MRDLSFMNQYGNLPMANALNSFLYVILIGMFLKSGVHGGKDFIGLVHWIKFI